MKMPCLSLWQPWATCCVRPLPDGRLKTLETRFWRAAPRAYIGRYIVIHAAKHRDAESDAVCRQMGWNQDTLLYGAALGIIHLRGWHWCTPKDEQAALCECVGKLGLEFANARAFDEPLPMRGCQGFWYEEIPDDLMPESVRQVAGLYR